MPSHSLWLFSEAEGTQEQNQTKQIKNKAKQQQQQNHQLLGISKNLSKRRIQIGPRTSASTVKHN